MTTPSERVTVVMVADIPAAGVDALQRYESRVLPLLDRHGGRLERRLRTADSRARCTSSPSPRAPASTPTLAQRVLEVHDVSDA